MSLEKTTQASVWGIDWTGGKLGLRGGHGTVGGERIVAGARMEAVLRVYR